MGDLKERLLPKPASAVNLGVYPSNRPFGSFRQLFLGVDALGLKKRGQGLRSWIHFDASTGNSQIIEIDKFTVMRRCDLPAHDLCLLDLLFVYPSTRLGREKAIVVNLGQIRCIITADEVLLLNSLDSYALQYVVELQRQLKATGVGDVWQSDRSDLKRWKGSMDFGDVSKNTSSDYLPFEFKASEIALEAACTFLDTQDNVRNQLIQFELLLTTATFMVAIFGVVAGIFGMNFPITLFDRPSAFEWVLLITGVTGVVLSCSFLWFYKSRRVTPF